MIVIEYKLVEDLDSPRQFMQETADLLLKDLRAFTPWVTGRLWRGWEIKTVTYRRFIIENAVPYGIYVDLGTPYITPRRFTERARQRLRRQLRSDGVNDRTFFTVSVDYSE